MLNFSKEAAEATIVRNGGSISGNQIVFSKPGLGILAAIDYLVHNHKYIWVQKAPDKKTKS